MWYALGCTEKHWRPGLAAGAGVEWAFTPNWTVKGEYLFIGAAGTGASKDELNLVRFGVKSSSVPALTFGLALVS